MIHNRLEAALTFKPCAARLNPLVASLKGRPDAIVFTDAIGEDEPLVRSRACDAFKFIGVEVDTEKNATSLVDTEISLPKSAVRVLIVKSREGWQIARDCHELCQPKPER